MNRLHVIAAAIEHASPDGRRVLAAGSAAHGAFPSIVGEHLRTSPPVEVLTGSLALTHFGVAANDLHGGVPVHVSWRGLAGLLTSVMAPATGRDLDVAHRAAVHGDTGDSRRLSDLRAALADHVALAARERTPSLFADGRRERMVLDGTIDPDRWGGCATPLLLVDEVVCRDDGAMVAQLQSTVAAHRVTVAVLQGRATRDALSAHVRRAWLGTVRHRSVGGGR